MSAILRLSGVSKRFGALLAVDNLSMHLNDGEALGVIGPNGSGKTTVFNILSGITKADQGEVFFQGTDITHLRAFERCRRGIARSFQIPRPFAGMSVFENLLVGAAFGDGKPERSVYDQCVQVLEETGSLPPADIEQKTIEQDGLAVSLTIVRPIKLKERGPAFLFFYGGGFVLGDFVTHERLVRDLVSDSEITAIFVNYTRSPEARYPTAINEAYAATKWVAANGGEINVDGKRLALVGNSAGATIEKNNNTFQEYRRARTPVRSRTRTAIPTKESGQPKRDLTVSSFILALVLVGVILAAHTDRPVFWLFIGPVPFAVLHTTRTFLRRRVIRREGLLMF